MRIGHIAYTSRGSAGSVRSRDTPLPKSKRKGIGLCLSGGGFRATLFHLGVLRRLNELGILTRDDFRTVASVSGGSITSARLADALTHVVVGPGAAIPAEVWQREMGRRCARSREGRAHGGLPRAARALERLEAQAAVDALSARYEEG